jgi:hypothetical protein
MHKHAILGDVSYQWQLGASGIQTSLRAAIPGSLKKLFASMSPSQDEHDLCSAAETIGVTTANLSTKILSSLTTRIRMNSNKAWIRDPNKTS